MWFENSATNTSPFMCSIQYICRSVTNFWHDHFFTSHKWKNSAWKPQLHNLSFPCHPCSEPQQHAGGQSLATTSLTCTHCKRTYDCELNCLPADCIYRYMSCIICTNMYKHVHVCIYCSVCTITAPPSQRAIKLKVGIHGYCIIFTPWKRPPMHASSFDFCEVGLLL